MTLFRHEAIAAHYGDTISRSVIPAEVPVVATTSAAAVCIVGLICLAMFGHYTRRVTAEGVLVPDRGTLRIQSRTPEALVRECFVKEGQKVKKGEALLSLSAEQLGVGPDDGAAKRRDAATAEEESLLANLQQRLDMTYRDYASHASARVQALAQARQQITNVESEMAQLDLEIGIQTERTGVAEENFRRQQDMVAKGFVSEAGLMPARSELLEQRGRVEALRRQRIALNRERDRMRTSFEQVVEDHRKQKDDVEATAAGLKYQVVAEQLKRSVLVVAPEDGVVTNVLVRIGQQAGSRTLVTMTPANATLEAQVNLPTALAGQVEAGQKATIRYAAFPYQRFGSHEGTVRVVSRSALNANELAEDDAQQSGTSEKLYRVRIALANQQVVLNGVAKDLAPGARFEVDIAVEKRSVLGWIFEPLQRARRRLQTGLT